MLVPDRAHHRWPGPALRNSPGAVAVLAALLASAACPGTRAVPAIACARDIDCKGARICGPAGKCIEPPPGSAAHETRTADDAASPPGKEPPHATPAPGSPPFAMFGGDGQNTGQIAGPAPDRAPQKLWSITTGGPVVGSPMVGPDGTIYATSHDGKLYAITPGGTIRFAFSTGDRVWSTPAVAADGTVYIGSDDDHLYAVDGKSGTEKWRLRIGACEPPIGFGPEGTRCDADGGPKIGPDGTIYLGGDGVYAVWPDGTLRWKFATPEHVMAAPALARAGSPEEGTLYAGCLDDALYAIAADGTKLWEVRTRDDIESAPAIGADGTIYFGSDDHALYAVAPDGSVRWKVITGGDIRSSPAIASDGTIYVGSHDGRLYAISPSGDVRWRVAVADKIQSSPAVAPNGVILFGSQDDHVYAVATDGRLLWYLAFDGDVDTTPWIARTGVLYAGSDDHTLRAFAPPARTPGPKPTRPSTNPTKPTQPTNSSS